MTASLRRTLRTIGIWMLGIAVPLAACASAPVRAVAGQAAGGSVAIAAGSNMSSAMAIVPVAARHRFRSSALEGIAPELATPAKTAGHRYNRRISAEDTTPPTPDALETSRLRVPMEPEARLRPAPALCRSAIASPATRQRAP